MDGSASTWFILFQEVPRNHNAGLITGTLCAGQIPGTRDSEEQSSTGEDEKLMGRSQRVANFIVSESHSIFV